MLVAPAGLEPALANAKRILSPQRLPIPPRGQPTAHHLRNRTNYARQSLVVCAGLVTPRAQVKCVPG